MTEAWWRFTGIAGLKPYLPDHIIQAARERKRGWACWYEPVCATCPFLASKEQSGGC